MMSEVFAVQQSVYPPPSIWVLVACGSTAHLFKKVTDKVMQVCTEGANIETIANILDETFQNSFSDRLVLVAPRFELSALETKLSTLAKGRIMAEVDKAIPIKDTPTLKATLEKILWF